MCVRCCFFFFLEALLWIMSQRSGRLYSFRCSLAYSSPTHQLSHPPRSNMRRVNAWLSQIITSAFHASVQSDLCADVEVRRMYFPSVAPIGQRPLLQLQPAVLKGGIIAHRPVAPFLGTGWNHLELAERLARLKHRILGHVTDLRLRPVSTNEGGREKKKKIEGRSAGRPCHFFFPVVTSSPCPKQINSFPQNRTN